MAEKISRRSFAKAGAATVFGLTALEAANVLGANERVRLGFIGLGIRGSQLIAGVAQHADAQIAALCDVSGSTLDEANQKFTQGKATPFRDFRKMIDRKDLDGV